MRSVSLPVALARATRAAPELLLVRPRVSAFLLKYLRKFRIHQVAGHLVVHSHLPPLNSPAYRRFVKLHLIRDVEGPSHAQIGATNVCRQNCAYCYNRGRTGEPMSTALILRVIDELAEMGVCWLGFTGGEPMLNRELPTLVEHAARHCAVKLFTTGCEATPERAMELADAGLFSVAVSLDHTDEATHDSGRGVRGAWRAALDAIDAFLSTDRLHVSVSAVVTPDMIRRGEVPALLDYLEERGVHEAWISEVKPSSEPFWKEDAVIDETDRLAMVEVQDAENRRRGMTVNYLGHFEGREHFGCNAGNKMVYVDPFGEVSPCVFTPMSFGSVRERPLEVLFREMKRRFPAEGSCFINRNWRLIREASGSGLPLKGEILDAMMQTIDFGPHSRFNEVFRQ